MRALVILLLLIAAQQACQQPSQVPDPYQPRPVEVLGQYPVVAEGAVIGRVLEIEILESLFEGVRGGCVGSRHRSILGRQDRQVNASSHGAMRTWLFRVASNQC